MLFNDYPFLLVFLPAALLIYRLADPYPQARIGVLVALSFVFYAYGYPPYVLLLALSIAINWLAALAFGHFKRRWIITAAIVMNLAVLGVFKYANFAAANLGLLLGRPMPHLDIVLPLGISFFTFHHIMYLVDLRRGKAPLYPADRYALYISFFPQLLAGPLVRWSEVMAQFGQTVYSPGWQRRFCIGAAFILAGLVEKILFGDGMSRLLDPIYAQAAAGPLKDGDAWLAISVAVQILYDFAGYCDIAIGLGLLFGVQLPFNFNAPFRAASIQDFWQRWHMTLMNFLRDYVYFPLINARILPRRYLPLQSHAATMITMMLCGLWHGASWTFVLWGVLHGFALMICALWRRHGPRLPSLAGWSLTVSFVLLTGVIFRAGSLEVAWHVFQGLAVLPDLEHGRHLLPLLLAPLAAFLLPASQDIVAFFTRRPNVYLAALVGIAFLALLFELGERDVHEFVYFKF
ncbi:MAG TPA: MBOAT family O-acyltransferase [Bradyrhizobium sp.]|uniref:MBOAT family O-acyltransferase n=1 Tax=Bradyrhizobium sp. TaxID=376 RepID=UPI002C2D2A69|nr:MBOAT family O-acyltransferase [Bradyrhizobium sp.]HLZ01319.1 MBOAT family O-acyltransferase [Bradyrhizobium sp.]